MMKIIYTDNFSRGDYQELVNYLCDMPTIYDGRERKRYIKCGAGFDIETSKLEWGVDDGREVEMFQASYCYHWQFSIGDKVYGGRSLDSMQVFFEAIVKALNKWQLYFIVWDANLGFEFNHCKNHWCKLGLSKIFAKERRNPLKLHIGEYLEMRECIGLFGHSLADIAKNYCKTQKAKGDLDYSLIRLSRTPMTETEISYCYNDVKILAELGDYVFRNFYGKNRALPLTSTGFIRNMIKQRIPNIKAVKKEIREWLPDEFLYNDFRKYLFKGGICGTNIVYMNQTLENVVCADLTSDYPACMLHRVYPIGKPTEIPTKAFMLKDGVPYIGLFRFVNVHSKTTHSIISQHKTLNRVEIEDHVLNHDDTTTIDNGRIYKTPALELYLNDVEFKAFVKAYDFDESESKCLRAWRFPKYAKLPRYVLDVLEEQYLKKENLKSTGQKNTQEYKDAKAFVNGIFGMMCTSIYTEIFEFDENGNIIEQVDEDGHIVSKSFNEATKGMFLSPFWGYWITSYARYILTDAITQFPECIVQYDTDSLYYLKDKKRTPLLEKYLHEYNERIYKLNDNLFNSNPHFRDLGAWEIEKPYAHFKGLGSKRYIHDDVDKDGNPVIAQVISGCRAGTLQAQLEYNNQVNGTNLTAYDFFKEGMIIDAQHSRKLVSTYVDGYIPYKGDFRPVSLTSTPTLTQEEIMEIYTPFVDGIFTDYLGYNELVKLESGVILNPGEFRMKIAESHIAFYQTMKGYYRNQTNLKDEIRPILDFYEME